MFTLCSNINVPIKSSKVEGPTTSLTFLGIHLNSKTMEASTSDERKHELLNELTWMCRQHKCTKWELLSLIGKLSFCCTVLQTGRIFLHRMIDLRTRWPAYIIVSASLLTHIWTFIGGLISYLLGQVPVLSWILDGHHLQLLTSTQMPPECMDGVRTGMAGWSCPIGHHLKPTWI